MKLVVIVSCLVCTALASWPPRVTTCPASKDLNEYNRCTLRLLRELTPKFPHGIKEANLPPLDPYHMDHMNINYNFPALSIAANLSNIRIVGATNYVLEDMFANPENLTLKVNLTMPYVESNSDYDIEGNLLILPITSIGHFAGNFSNTVIQATAVGREFLDERNVRRVSLDKLNLKLRIGDGKIKLVSPPKYRAVANSATQLFNSNKRLILNIATPLFERNVALIVKTLLEKALQTFTKDELIP